MYAQARFEPLPSCQISLKNCWNFLWRDGPFFLVLVNSPFILLSPELLQIRSILLASFKLHSGPAIYNEFDIDSSWDRQTVAPDWNSSHKWYQCCLPSCCLHCSGTAICFSTYHEAEHPSWWRPHSYSSSKTTEGCLKDIQLIQTGILRGLRCSHCLCYPLWTWKTYNICDQRIWAYDGDYPSLEQCTCPWRALMKNKKVVDCRFLLLQRYPPIHQVFHSLPLHSDFSSKMDEIHLHRCRSIYLLLQFCTSGTWHLWVCSDQVPMGSNSERPLREWNCCHKSRRRPQYCRRLCFVRAPNAITVEPPDPRSQEAASFNNLLDWWLVSVKSNPWDFPTDAI